MSWRDKLLSGSFRDVPFVVEATDGEIGRRVALHEYPARNKPFAEDMGRKARRFTLDLFVVGSSYMTQRDQLIAAIEAEGAGKLIHPYLGEMTVTVMEARGPRETTRQGGMARFTVTFVESGESVFPDGVEAGGENVKAAADNAALAVRSEFITAFNADGPGWISDHAKSLISKVTDKIKDIKNSIPGLPTAVVQFETDLNNLASEVASLIRTPADLATQLYGLVADIALLPDRPRRALDAYRQLFDVLQDEPAIVATTPLRTRQSENQVAIAAFVRRAAIVESARSVADVDFQSLDDAIVSRDELADQLDIQMDVASDTVFAAMTDLRTELVRYVSASSGDLARLVSYTPAATLPAVVIAHSIYGDATRAAEIIERNNFKHPGFVPGGVAIEVLTNA